MSKYCVDCKHHKLIQYETLDKENHVCTRDNYTRRDLVTGELLEKVYNCDIEREKTYAGYCGRNGEFYESIT